MLDPQSVRLHVGSAEALRKQRFCFRAWISPKGDGRQIGIADVDSNERSIGWNACSWTAPNHTKIDHRRSVGAEDEHIVKGRICVNGIATSDNQILVETGVPGEAQPGLKVLVELVDRREGAGR